MGTTAKSLLNTALYVARRHIERINRRMDDRYFLLVDSLHTLEQYPASAYALITELPATLISADISNAAVTGIAVKGVNFLGDATQAVGATTRGVGKVTFTAVRPGEQTIVVSIVPATGSLTITADIAAGTVTVTLATGGSTAAAIIAAVNAHAEAKFMVNAAATTPGAITLAETVTLNNGTGELMTLSIGEYAIDGNTADNGITDVTDTQITLDLNPAAISGTDALTAGKGYPIYLRVDGQLVPVVTIIPVA
jgi:hypothetical protein